MASGIAHEINQPLNIISMVLEKILFDTSRNQKIDIAFVKEKSERIFENITRIRNIIDHIRAFSRNHDDYVFSSFNINTAIENAVSMTTEQFKHLGIDVFLNLDRELPAIFGNTYKFEQVIVNLLVNSKDAVLEKKGLGNDFTDMVIGIRSFMEDHALIVEVTDNGMGIKDDDIDNVILPFYTTKDEGKGTGLGLSICYQIIKELNGTIDIISTRSSGTKIRITLEIKAHK
jgi:C4-dicarboxylate-specific signal transduction histidine kinase